MPLHPTRSGGLAACHRRQGNQRTSNRLGSPRDRALPVLDFAVYLHLILDRHLDLLATDRPGLIFSAARRLSKRSPGQIDRPHCAQRRPGALLCQRQPRRDKQRSTVWPPHQLLLNARHTITCFLLCVAHNDGTTGGHHAIHQYHVNPGSACLPWSMRNKPYTRMPNLPSHDTTLIASEPQPGASSRSPLP